MKIFILGGRSGTSTMARLLEASGLKLWSTVGSTEPPYIQSVIYKNAGTKTGEKKIRKAFGINDSWNLAKLPEFAFCLPLIEEIYPNSKYVIMTRPIEERVESHLRMGWHFNISERVQESKPLQRLIEDVTGEKPNDDPVQNDRLYFEAIDVLTVEHFSKNPKNACFVQYEHFNADFPATMRVVANFLNLSFFQNIETWRALKRIPHQAGRWQSAR